MEEEPALVRFQVSSTNPSESPEMPNDSAAHFRPYVILEFAPNLKQAAIEWFTAKLVASKPDHGAELLVKSSCQERNKETLLYISSSTDRLLIGADEIKMKKRYKDGVMREFTLTDIDEFENSEDLDEFLTVAQRQKVIMKAIEHLRAQDDECFIPGYPKHTLYPGKTIVNRFLSRRLITNLYPLHDEEELKRLGSEWYSVDNYLKPQPIDKINAYFGEKIALYFSFLGIYTLSLVPPALIGILYFIISRGSVYREASFAVFNLVWSTVFLEGWKRYCNSLCFKWGSIDSSSSLTSSFEEPRADYHGEMGKNEITGLPEPKYPKWKRVLRFYLVTVPIITFCLTIAFFAMLGYFAMEAWMRKNAPQDLGILTTLNNLTPTVVYAIVIAVLNGIYRAVALRLNKYENHRLQSSYDNHLIVKLLLFEFVNCFICLFYVAFYLKDMKLLRTFLGTVLITQQIAGQVQESLVPFLFIKRRQKQVTRAMSRTITEVSEGGVDSMHKKQAALEGMMQMYGGSNDEYLEMYIQFGYVYLFSSVFPLAALWALLNNIIEIRSDAFKLCRVLQRPFQETAKNIGAWQPAFELIGLISVITNCALIGMDPEVQKLLPSDLTPVNMVLLFVAAEHIVIATKASIALLIPDVPRWIHVEMAKQEYTAKLALRKQRIIQAAHKKAAVMSARMRRTPFSTSTQSVESAVSQMSKGVTSNEAN